MGASLKGLGNDQLKWQQKLNYNLGFEAQLFQNKLSVIADVYQSRTKDLVSSVNLPLSNGFASYIDNIGEVENKGFELKATYYIVRNSEQQLTWSITAAINHNRNKIVSISQALKDAQKALEESKGSNPNRLYREGESISTIYVVPSLGIDPSCGKEQYLNRFNQPTYTWNALDVRASGLAEPKYRGNINSYTRYKNLSITIALGYQFGGQIYNQTLIDKVENADFRWNVDSRVYDDRWSKPGDQAAFKGLLIKEATNKTSRFVQDERTLTCQNINLQYDVRSGFLSKHLGLKTLTLTGNMQDVFYISSVKREGGLMYPFSRQFSFGLSAIF